MKRGDLSIFVGSALNNKGMVAVHAISGMVVIFGTVAFSALAALYFGIDMFGIQERFPSAIVRDRTGLIVMALLVSATLLLARVVQSVVEAKVIIAREKWFAEQIRQGKISGPGNIARASNYYGRLSSSSMKAVSTTVILAVNLVVMGVILPATYMTGVMLLILLCSSALYFAMRSLSTSMASSSQRLSENGKHMAAWKQNVDIPYDSTVDQYYRSYFRRIFLASTFSFTPAIFSLVFCIALFVAQEMGVFELNVGEAFIAYVLLQAYLGVIGKFFGSFVHASAFLPAVRPYFGTESDSSTFSPEDTLEDV